MNKLSYGSYNSSNTDIAFSSENGYVDPATEAETRKQLSYPLKEVKEFVNKTVAVDSNNNAVQLIVSSNSLQYKTDPSATPISVVTGGGSSNPDTETIASGDSLVFYDVSKTKVAKSSINFGAGTGTFLRNDGTWGAPLTYGSDTTKFLRNDGTWEVPENIGFTGLDVTNILQDINLNGAPPDYEWTATENGWIVLKHAPAYSGLYIDDVMVWGALGGSWDIPHAPIPLKKGQKIFIKGNSNNYRTQLKVYGCL